MRAPRAVRELETRSSEAAGELVEVFGSSKFGPWSLLESSLDVRELHMIVLEALGERDEVFGGSRIRQEGSMSTKRYA